MKNVKNKRNSASNKALALRFAKVMKMYRTEQNMTQEELSEKSGIDVSTIKRLENPDLLSNPELFTMGPIIEALNIDPNDIFCPGKITKKPDLHRLIHYLLNHLSNAEAKLVEPSFISIVEMVQSKKMKTIKE